MKKMKNLFCVLLSACLTMQYFQPVIVLAEEEIVETEPETVETEESSLEDSNTEEPMPEEVESEGQKCGANVTWSLEDDVLTIQGQGAITSIPWQEEMESIKQVRIQEGITSICDEAFMGASSLKNVELPSTLQSIGNCAFDWCTALTQITIPENVEQIGNLALAYTPLEEVRIPKKVQHLSGYTFLSSKIKRIVVDSENANYVVENNILYSKDMSHLIYVPRKTDNTSLQIPDSVEEIDDFALYGNDSITYIELGKNVNRIGVQAFPSLYPVTLKVLDKVPTIEEDSFLSGIITIQYSEGNENWEDIKNSGASYGADELNWETYKDINSETEDWTIQDGVLTVSMKTMDDYDKKEAPWYDSASQIRELVVTKDVERIGENAFYGLDALEKVTLPTTLSYIGNNAFMSCGSIQKVFYIGEEDALKSIRYGNEYASPARSYYAAVYVNDYKVDKYANIDYSMSDTYIKGKYGEAVTFNLVLYPKSSFVNWIEWYDSNDNLIEGAHDLSYTIESLTDAEEYTCKIINCFGLEGYYNCRADVRANWTLKNQFYHYTVSKGDSLDLEVQFTASSQKENLQFTWYDDDYNVLEEKGAILSLNSISKPQKYRCTIVDPYGNEERASFEIDIPKSWYLVSKEINVKKQKSFIYLNVPFTLGSSTSNLSYQWYAHRTELPGETNSCYIVDEDSDYSDYTCVVSDPEGNTESVCFNIVESVPWEFDDLPNNGNISVDYGQDAVCFVPVKEFEGKELLSYSWRTYDPYGYYEDMTNTFVVSNVTEDQTVECSVRNPDGRVERFTFHIRVNRPWKVKNTDNMIKLNHDGDTVLSVSFTDDSDTSGLTYQWYDAMSNPIEGANTPSYFLDKKDVGYYYYCIVEDANHISTKVGFNIAMAELGDRIDYGYSLELADQDFSGRLIYNLYAKEGQPLDITIPFLKGSNTSNLSTNWSGQYLDGNVDSKNPFVYHISSLERDEFVDCAIFDDNLSSNTHIEFRVHVSRDWQLKDTNNHIYVDPEDRIVLSPEFKEGSDLSGLQIYWDWRFDSYSYDSGSIIEIVDNGNALSLSRIQDRVDVTCTLCSKDGVEDRVYYTVEPAKNWRVDYQKTQTIIRAHTGDDVVIPLYFTKSSNLKNVSINWYRKNGIDMSDFLTTDDYEIKEDGVHVYNITKPLFLNAYIEDGKGNYEEVAYRVEVFDKEVSTISLEDLTVEYNRKVQPITPAKVTGSTGNVSYRYYTDANCTSPTTTRENGALSIGGAPRYPGVYYVKASVDEDEKYTKADSNVAVLTIESDEPVTARLEGYSISLAGDICVYFYMYIPEYILESPNEIPYMQFTTEKGMDWVEINEAIRKTVNGETFYAFPVHVSAKEMTMPIQASFGTRSGASTCEYVTYTFSVEEYANYIIEHKEDFDEEVEKIAKAMLNYGYYAQQYFGYRLDALPTIDQAFTTTPEYQPYVIEDQNDEIQFVGARLILTSKLGLKLYFLTQEELEVDAQNYDIGMENKYTVVTIYDVDSINTFYHIHAKDFSLRYGITSYAYQAQQTNNVNLKNLVHAIYELDQLRQKTEQEPEEDIIVDQGSCGENVSWTLNDKGVLSIQGIGDMSDYSYREKAPWDTESVKSVCIEEGVTRIGNSSFSGCSMLENISIPSSLTCIGSSAFSNCESLNEIMIPYGVTSIGGGAFDCCNSLKEVNIPDSVTSIDSSAFSNCQQLEHVSLPKQITTLENFLFLRCPKLNHVIIPEGVISIGEDVFDSCTNLNDVKLPGTLTELGAYAFYNTALDVVNLPDSLTYLGYGAFADCKQLSTITISDGVETIMGDVFNGCTALENVQLPNNLKVIEEGAFWTCRSLKSVVIPASTLQVGNMNFCYCDALESVKILGSATSIRGSFHDCPKLKDVYLYQGSNADSYFTDEIYVKHYL